MKHVLFTIRDQQKLARDVWRMDLEGDVSAIAAPGQFVEVALEGFFLRRPISVCDCAADRLTLVYKVIGQGTEKMSRMAAGERLAQGVFMKYLTVDGDEAGAGKDRQGGFGSTGK